MSVGVESSSRIFRTRCIHFYQLAIPKKLLLPAESKFMILLIGMRTKRITENQPLLTFYENANASRQQMQKLEHTEIHTDVALLLTT